MADEAISIMKKFKHTNEELERARLEAEGGSADREGVSSKQNSPKKGSKYGQSIIEF